MDQNRELGSPVEILVDLQYAEVSKLVREAGIYMHTLGKSQPFGMPISIAEAMATGAVVLLRDRPEAREYGGEVAYYYEEAEDAAQIIGQTINWMSKPGPPTFNAPLEGAHSISQPECLCGSGGRLAQIERG